MSHSPRVGRLAPTLLVLALALGACQTATASPSDSSGPTGSATPSEPEASEPPTPEPSPSATVSPTPSVAATVAPTATPPPGEFAIAPNAAADALFLDRDECANPADGYRLAFPDAWWTNTAFGRIEPCSWFSPTFYEVAGDDAPPTEIAIVIALVDGDVGFFEEIVSREVGRVGVTQDAVRIELRGAAGSGGQMPAEWREYAYIVQLGPSPEEGPNLYVRTATDMGGDYELNRAVLDRMMATIEFVGSIQ
jgi:hypothetical protein